MSSASAGSPGLPVESRSLGAMRIHALDAGCQMLDGGAMFGVVPKVLWEKKIPSDERNRIPLALRCLLVEAPQALVLIDTGIGNKESDKFTDLFGVENDGDPTRLEDSIRAAGFSPEDVDIVLSTHLHFDHAGGNTMVSPAGEIVPSFPRARYVVQEREFEFAQSGNARIRASYLAPNFMPIAASGQWDFVDGSARVTEGVEVELTPGHTPFHQSVILRSGGEVACFLADVCPTSAHLPLPWIMGYDLEPLVTLESKRGLWTRARDEGWVLVFEHDPDTPWGCLDPDSERPVLLKG